MTQLAETCSRCSRPIRLADTPYLHKEKVICELCHAALHPATPAPHPPLTARLHPTPRPAVPTYRLLQLTGTAFHGLALLTLLAALFLLALAIKSTVDAGRPALNFPDAFAPITAAVAYYWAACLFVYTLLALGAGQALLRLRDLVQNSHRALLP